MQTFRDFMEAALYDPERGYYSRRTPTEDFYTAPELHPAYAGALARVVAQRFELMKAAGVPGPYSVVEMGCGQGRLGRALLCEFKQRHPAWATQTRYVLIERSRTALLDAIMAASQVHGQVLGYSRLEELLPCSGIFLSNELVDAFPVHLLEKRSGRVFEVYVEDSGRTVLSDLSTPELVPHAQAVEASLAEGERHAVNLEARRWLRLVSQKLEAGYVVTIDYGKRFGASPNPPRTFYRHTTDELVTDGKGRKDITASVDFDALIDEGGRLGLGLELYGSLSRFLLEAGIADWMPSGDSVADLKARTKIKTLIHPEGMGEVFKVLIQKRSPELPQ